MNQPHLIMVLQGPMLSYGRDAVDRKRPTDYFPGKSMLTGLLGNALGYRRQDADQLNLLQRSLHYAARSESMPEVGIMRDFHTAQLHIDDRGWTTYGAPEGRAGSPPTYQSPEIRDMEYVVDCRTVVAMTVDESEGPPSLDQLAQALRQPARPLFIGRKTCVPDRPIYETIIDAPDATTALYQTPPAPDVTRAQVQWDGPQQHHSFRKEREVWVSDLRDWRNRVHTGRRLVNRGTQTLTTTEPEHDHTAPNRA